MKYCPNCHVLVDTRRCGICRSRNLRQPESGDYCLFADKEPVWAGALEDILEQNAIPYVAEESGGAWLVANLGQAWQRKRFYVPYGYLERARELERDFFSGDFVLEEGTEG